MSNIQDTIEGLPFYDQVVDMWNEYAGEHFQTKDPYVETLPDGKTRKRKLPEYCSKDDQKVFKKIQKKAWIHDKCFMGCYPVDCGVGMAPILALVPVVGPLLMYAIHSRLIHFADQKYHLETKTVAKMELNILFDLIISFPPIIGSLLSFLNACSTRNAAIIYNAVSKRGYEQQQRQQQQYQQQGPNTNIPSSPAQSGGPFKDPSSYDHQQSGNGSKINKFLDKFDNVKLNQEAQEKRSQQQRSGVYPVS